MREREVEPDSVQECKNKEEWDKFAGKPTIKKGEWEGPGFYVKFGYAQSCPRGCCYDDVTELKPRHVIQSVRTTTADCWQPVKPRGQRDLPKLTRSTKVFKTALDDRRNGTLANVSDRRSQCD